MTSRAGMPNGQSDQLAIEIAGIRAHSQGVGRPGAPGLADGYAARGRGDQAATAEAAICDAASRLDSGGADAVIGTDIDGLILYWNARAESLYGWRATEVLGRNVLDVTPSMLGQTEAEAIMQQLLGGQLWSGRFNVRDKSGRPMRMYVTDVPVHHRGRVVGVVGLSVPSTAP
jgi:PAS domain S-box-containing protein